MIKNYFFRILRSTVAAALIFGMPNISKGVSFEGKTITVVIPFKEGGGTSRVFRFFQRLY